MAQPQQNTEPMPRIIVSETDYNRLVSLAAAAEERAPDVAGVLRTELERARVVSAASHLANVVQMGSTVEFRSDTGHHRRVKLVFPGDADIAEGRISILTPIGAALIGLSQGQSIAWKARDGRQHHLTVVNVEQPETSSVRSDPEHV